MGEMTEHERMAREDIGGWLNPEDLQIPAGMPQPQLWRMLVAPIQPRRQSKGGIHLPDAAVDNQEFLTNVGKVIACGAMVGRKPEWLRWPRWAGVPVLGWFARPQQLYEIKVGDWVVFGQYAGMRFEFKGVKAILLNDDEVLAKAEGPEGFRIYI